MVIKYSRGKYSVYIFSNVVKSSYYSRTKITIKCTLLMLLDSLDIDNLHS